MICEVCKIKNYAVPAYKMCGTCFRRHIAELPCYECGVYDKRAMIDTENDEGFWEKYHEECYQIACARYTKQLSQTSQDAI